MKKDMAMQCAAFRAKQRGEPYVAYRAGPHWLCEAESHFMQTRPKHQDMKTFYPPEEKKTQIEGHIEIDHTRGVIYFHAAQSALCDGYPPTIVRICNLGDLTNWEGKTLLDITNKYGAAYEPKY